MTVSAKELQRKTLSLFHCLLRKPEAVDIKGTLPNRRSIGQLSDRARTGVVATGRGVFLAGQHMLIRADNPDAISVEAP